MTTSDNEFSGSTYASVTRSNLPSSSSTQAQPSRSAALDPNADPADLVAASLERSRANLERFQRQQAAAVAMELPARSRRRRQADVPDLFGAEEGNDEEVEDAEFPDRESSAQEERRRRERLAREREEEEMARAIAASLAESEQREPAGEAAPDVVALPRTTRAEPMDEDEELDEEEEEGVQGDFDFHHEARLYDDEDAQLQAAINASLQEQALPTDWKLPAGETAPVRSAERVAADERSHVEPPVVQKTGDTVEEDETETETEPEVQELSAEELRRKRLERFL